MTRRPDALRGATIVGTGMYVPERRLTNPDLERMVDTTDAWILERTGIRERRIAAPDQASSDLGLIAAQRALEMAGIGPEDVDQLVVATTTPDRFLPSCACTLQAKLGARNAAAYDMFAACSGFIFGLGIARGVIGAGFADTVLLVGRRGAVAHHGLHGPQHLRAVRRRGRGRGAAPLRARATASSRSPSTATASTATCSRSRRGARGCRPAPRPSRAASTS